MSFDFPASPADGTIYVPPGGPQYQYSGGAWRVASSSVPIATAETRNRIVNGAMQISQENGNTSGTITGYFPADQWQHAGIMPAGYTYSTQRVQSYTANGSLNRIRNTVTVGAAMAAGNAVSLQQAIEGIRITDFLWGAGTARQAILRFGFKGPAGTYSISLRNNATNRAYVAPFTITAGQANTDTVQTLIIPGDTTGVWQGDTNPGIYLCICIAVGTTFAGTAGWQAGNIIGLTGQTNGVATNGNVFELFDVGLYLDPLNTGIAPPWQMPDEAAELIACQRYYSVVQSYILSGYNSAGGAAYGYVDWKATMRIAPAVAFSALGASNTNGFVNNGAFAYGMQATFAVVAAGFAYAIANIAANARM